MSLRKGSPHKARAHYLPGAHSEVTSASLQLWYVLETKYILEDETTQVEESLLYDLTHGGLSTASSD